MIETCSFLTTSWNFMLLYVRRLNNYQNSLLSPFFWIFEDFHFFDFFPFFHFWIFFKRLFCARSRKELTSRNAFPLLVIKRQCGAGKLGIVVTMLNILINSFFVLYRFFLSCMCVTGPWIWCGCMGVAIVYDVEGEWRHSGIHFTLIDIIKMY